MQQILDLKLEHFLRLYHFEKSITFKWHHTFSKQLLLLVLYKSINILPTWHISKSSSEQPQAILFYKELLMHTNT